MMGCNNCALAKTRNNIVFGEGDIESPIMFVGEAPGKNEDLQGKPFIGAAGKILTNYIEYIGWKREQCYITNIVKCRPPNNRNPRVSEIQACSPLLNEEIEKVDPIIIISLGVFATRYFLNTNKPMGDMRGKLFEKNGFFILPMYHPAALLRQPDLKEAMMDDFTLLIKLLKVRLKPRFSKIKHF
jgi:uracil-DNA glycosylase